MFSLAKGNEEEEVQAKAQQDGGGEQVSAADYDPSLDRREDEHKRVWGTKEEPQDVEMIEEEEEEEDVDDMFAVATTEKKVKKVKRVVVRSLHLYGFLPVDAHDVSHITETRCSSYHHDHARFCRRS